MLPEKDRIEITQYGELPNRLNSLFQTLERKGLLVPGRINTGTITRNSQEKEIRMRIERKRNIWTVLFEISEVPKDRLIKWLGDLTVTVPIANTGFLRRNNGRTIHWSDLQTRIKLRIPEGVTELSCTDIFRFQEKTKQISNAVSFVDSVVGRLNGHREMIRDLTGKTLVVD